MERETPAWQGVHGTYKFVYICESLLYFIKYNILDDVLIMEQPQMLI